MSLFCYQIFAERRLAQLKLRLRTLLDKKKVLQSRSSIMSKVSSVFITLDEGFQHFINDLNKLQVSKAPLSAITSF